MKTRLRISSLPDPSLQRLTPLAAADVTAFLTELGVTPDEKIVEVVIKGLAGKPFHEAVNAGLEQVSSLSMGGGGGGAAAANGDAEEAAEEQEESEEEADVSMGGLFSD